VAGFSPEPEVRRVGAGDVIVQQQVLVKWIIRGVAEGKLRLPGDEDVLLQKKARFLKASGIVDIIGPAERTVPMLTFDEEDGA